MRVLLAVNAPRMAAGIIAPLVSEAEARGVDRAAMLGALGVDEATLGSRDGWVRVDRVFAAWELAMRAIRDDGLPIAVATRSDIEALGVLGYALYTGRDGRSALDALVRYHDLVNDSGTWRLRVVGDQCIVTWDRPGDRLLGMRVANEQVLATFVALSDRITTSRATIHEVTFRHPAPRDVRAHEAHFRGEVRWGAPEDAVAFDAGFLSETPRGFDPVTSAFFEKALAQEKEKAGPVGSWAHRVAGVVSGSLAAGLPTLARVAEELGTSARTLRRRLGEEGTGYEAILTDLQQRRADAMLGRGAPLRDIAFAVGYADVSAFSRAYKRWTGTAPSETR